MEKIRKGRKKVHDSPQPDYSDDYSPQRLPEEYKKDKRYLANLPDVSKTGGGNTPLNIQIN